MPRLLGALAALYLLTACPPLDPVWVTTDALPAPVPADPSDSESSTGALPTTSTTDAAAPTTGGLSTSTSSSADESTGSTGADIEAPPPLACAPTEDFCWTFEAWCPFYYDTASCEAVAPECIEWGSVCGLCSAARASCEVTWGEGSGLCALGEQKCLASVLLPECACQPAVFLCAASQRECPEGYAFDGATCRPPCDDGFSLDTEGLPSEECGPPEYATCEDGYCAPHVLVLCL